MDGLNDADLKLYLKESHRIVAGGLSRKARVALGFLSRRWAMAATAPPSPEASEDQAAFLNAVTVSKSARRAKICALAMIGSRANS